MVKVEEKTNITNCCSYVEWNIRPVAGLGGFPILLCLREQQICARQISQMSDQGIRKSPFPLPLLSSVNRNYISTTTAIYYTFNL